MTIHHIEASFGCLSGTVLRPKSGLNIITAPNESGKSTICAFLLAMFYGLPGRERDRKDSLSQKTHYRPFSGAPMEGMIECEWEGREIRLRRDSMGGVPMGNFSAEYIDSGLPVPELTGENVGERLFGLTRDVFSRSLFILQQQLEIDQHAELESHIASYLSEDGQYSFALAQDQLGTWQRSLRFQNRGKLPGLEAEILQLKKTRDQALLLRDEQLGLAAQWTADEVTLRTLEETEDESVLEARTALKEQIAATRKKLDSIKEEEQQLFFEAPRLPQRSHGTTRILLFVLLALGVVAPPLISLLLPVEFSFSVALIPSLFCLLAILILLYRESRRRQDTGPSEALLLCQNEKFAVTKQLQALTTEHQALVLKTEQTKQNLQKKIQTAREQHSLLQGRLQELGGFAELEAKLESSEAAYAEGEKNYAALTEAITRLSNAEEALRARFSPTLTKKTSEYFSRMTGGRYEALSLSRDFSAQVKRGSGLGLHSALHLSRGSRDQLALALRLALCDLLLPERHNLPLILDDVLQHFDDDRLLEALSLLQELAANRQILLFSCQKREAEVLKNTAVSILDFTTSGVNA